MKNELITVEWIFRDVRGKNHSVRFEATVTGRYNVYVDNDLKEVTDNEPTRRQAFAMLEVHA